MGDNSCPSNPPNPNIHSCHYISNRMAVGVGWSDPVQHFGSDLCGLGLGTIPLERLCVDFWSFGLGRCSFSVQLDIQSTTTNMIITAQPRFQRTAALLLAPLLLSQIVGAFWR